MQIDKFIKENVDKRKLMMKNYNILNSINVPSKISKFPYNILKVEVTPTYKTISGIIKKKDFYLDKKGGCDNEITVFLF